MSENIIPPYEEAIKGQLSQLVRGTVEETLNKLLDEEAEPKNQKTPKAHCYRGFFGARDRSRTGTEG